MEKPGVFGEVLEAADWVSPGVLEALMEVWRRQWLDERREEIAREIAAARREFHTGQCRPAILGGLRTRI